MTVVVEVVGRDERDHITITVVRRVLVGKAQFALVAGMANAFQR